MATILELNVVGKSLRATGIHLYPGDEVAEWRAAMTTAQQQLAGVSSGVGFFGSPGWVIAGAVATAAIEGALSSKSAKEGVHSLARANKLLENLRLSGETYLFGKVSGLDNPSPTAWRAQGDGYAAIDMSKVPMLDVGRILEAHGKTKADIQGGRLEVPANVAFVSLDEDFIRLRLEEGSFMNVRWSLVDTFRFVEA
jgi:hypothetical protein